MAADSSKLTEPSRSLEGSVLRWQAPVRKVSGQFQFGAVLTVQAQVEVAAYAANTKIAEGVIERLRDFGNLLVAELRKVDFAGRVGGAEFALLLETEAEAAVVFAERLCQKVADHQLRHDSLSLRITISIGVAEMHSGDSRPDNSLARADWALYQAKKNGRNRVAIDA